MQTKKQDFKQALCMHACVCVYTQTQTHTVRHDRDCVLDIRMQSFLLPMLENLE